MPKLIELGKKFHERVNLARLDGQEIVYVVRIPTQLTRFEAMIAGRRLSALTTSSGRAMIARFPEPERRKAIRTWPIVALTPKTTRDRTKIAAAVEDAVKTGYGLTQNESIVNEIGIAATIVAATLGVGYMLGFGFFLLQAVGPGMPMVAAIPLAISAVLLLPLMPEPRRALTLAAALLAAAAGIALWVLLDPVAPSVPVYADAKK